MYFLQSLPKIFYTNPAFSAINPILYNALSTKFRRAFRRTLHCGEVRVSGSGGTGLPTPSLTYLANTRLSTVSMMQGDSFNMHRSVLRLKFWLLGSGFHFYLLYLTRLSKETLEIPD